MSIVNLRAPLATKMGHWLAEAQEHAGEIARIESLFERLDDLREREGHLRRVLDCASVVMKEINPDWTDDQLKPVKKHMHQGAGRPGEVARFTLDVLREAQEPLSARSITHEVLRRLGLDSADKKVEDRTYRNVEASLRAKHDSGLVEHDGTYGRKWKIAV